MRLYRLLLYLYPASFRNEYGEEMCRLFAERRRGASFGTCIGAWMEAVSDALTTAPRVHLDVLGQDLRYARRSLLRTPAFALTAIAVTALGIGANTAVFSITDRVLLKPLPYKDPDRLVQIWEKTPAAAQMEPSIPNYRDWRQMASCFESMGAHISLSVNMIHRDPERLAATGVTSHVLPLLGVQPALGRWFLNEEDRPGAAGAVILSDALWRRAFGSDPDVVGTQVRLDPEVFTIVGVMPAGFYYPDRETQLWVPARLPPDEDRDDNWLGVVARLRPGVTLHEARGQMESLMASLERSYPKENERTRATVRLFADRVPNQSRMLLRMLAGGSLCLLLIACTNLASLLLTRFIARRREITVRAALGAGRERIVRQLLTETLLLSSVGGAAGVALAAITTPLLARLVPTTLPVADATVFDVRVLLFAAAVTTLTGVVFGVVPALRVWRGADAGALREGPRAAMSGRERLRGALVVAQISASIVLLVCAGLMMRALMQVQTIDPGFSAKNVLTMRTALPAAKYKTTASKTQFYDRVTAEVSALPGVVSVAYTSGAPMAMRGGIWPVEIKGQGAVQQDLGTNMASLRIVTPAYLQTLDIPFRSGRDVAESDTFDARFVAVVSESFANRYWPNGDAIGRTFKMAFFERTIVGIVGDVRVRGLERISEPQVYVPYKQFPDGGVPIYAPKDLVIKTAGDSTSIASAVRAIIGAADPELPISDVRTMEDIVALETASRRTQISVLGLFAAMALLLAGVGIHGLVAFAVSQRRQEIGVRMALGARPINVLAMVMRESAVLAGIGCVTGMVLGYFAGRGFDALLAGVRPGDVPTFFVAAAVTLLMTLSGSLVPALRAVKVDPSSALRNT